VRAGYFIDAKEELRKEPDEQVENLGCQPEADEEQPEDVLIKKLDEKGE
jgi:hypothetical protein